ncbi:MAG: hypothetical protein IID55_02005 [Proteobacteria bacterium]|nr:hypothetical protein [Pseudomonadota bacterium]
MRFARVTATFGGILLAAALAGEATAAESDLEDTRPALIEDASPIGSSAALVDLDKLRARGTGDSESTSRAREAIGPILLIFLLRQNRFADGIDILQPVTTR